MGCSRLAAALVMRAVMLSCALLAASARAQEPDRDTTPDGTATPLALTLAQQQAVGILLEHPVPLSTTTPIEAFGTVLDPAALVADAGRVASTRAAASAAAADAARLERLYHEDTQASLKAWQAAQAQSVEAGAQARAAAMSFTLQWGPLAGWGAAQQQQLLAALERGQRLLLRADVPGYRVGGALDAHALVEIEGVSISARVLGPLPRTEAQTQNAGWLLELEQVPPGLGPGAHARVRLRTAAATRGLLVPATALLYAEQGAYVYRRVAEADGPTLHYRAVSVKPLARVGGAWLVDGLNRGDQVVVQGAGVLWSLQGISSFSAAEEEHD
jgi:hypothetical protein